MTSLLANTGNVVWENQFCVCVCLCVRYILGVPVITEKTSSFTELTKPDESAALSSKLKTNFFLYPAKAAIDHIVKKNQLKTGEGLFH